VEAPAGLLFSRWIRLVNKKHIRIVVLKPNKDLHYMNELFGVGKMKPLIDGPYKLEDVPEAFRIFGKSEHKGKLVITLV
jgi:NADPH:quinone reductase-like Zn-dependent oxidoreductase